MDPLSRLLARIAPARRGRTATIRVERDDLPDDPSRFRAIVLVDRRQRGDLVGRRAREFRVPPGRHEVRAYLGRGKLATLTVDVGPGKTVALRCGVTAEWSDAQRHEGRVGFLATVAPLALAGFVWMVLPSFRKDIPVGINVYMVLVVLFAIRMRRPREDDGFYLEIIPESDEFPPLVQQFS